VALQYLFGGIFGLITNLFLKKFDKRHLQFFKNRQFYFRTILFASYLGLIFLAIGAVEREQLPIVTLLNYLWPTMTMLLSIWLLKQKYRPLLLALGSAAVLVGLSIEILGGKVSSFDLQMYSNNSLIAFSSATFAAVAWGFYNVLNRIWGDLAGGIVGLPFVMLISSAVLFGVRFIFNEKSQFPPEIYLPLGYLLIIPYIANLCWDVGTRKGSITLLSLLADSLPWVSITISSLYLGIVIESKTWISAVLIVAGALITRLSLKPIIKVDPSLQKS